VPTEYKQIHPSRVVRARAGVALIGSNRILERFDATRAAALAFTAFVIVNRQQPASGQGEFDHEAFRVSLAEPLKILAVAIGKLEQAMNAELRR